VVKNRRLFMGNRTFDGEAISMIIDLLEDGIEKMEALEGYIKEADEAKENYYRLLWRYEYACQAIFHSDSSKAIPVAAEFGPIYEENPDILPGEAGAEMYLMITQMGIDPVVYLPQIPMEQWEDMMDKFYALVKRFNTGLRTYWWQMARFWRYIDKEKAFGYFKKSWNTGRDGLSDCRACERGAAVSMSLLIGDRKAADEYAKPLKAGRMEYCKDSRKFYLYAYLEDALDRGDIKEAKHFANKLVWKAEKNIPDLNYTSALLRCFAYTDKPKALEKFNIGIKNIAGLWDKKKIYDFYKASWVYLHEAAKNQETIDLKIPDNFPVYRGDGCYNCKKLAEWFHGQAENIGQLFDKRNQSSYFKEDMGKAMACEGQEISL